MSRLAKDTIIYGLSSIIGKFFNWLLVPLYTFVLAQQSDYGIVTNLYSWTALFLVILTYGMETGFFRFANKDSFAINSVYTTSLTSLFFTSVLFALLTFFFSEPIAIWLHYPSHSDFIKLLGIVVSVDAFASIPFAYLRYKNKALIFATLKLLFVILNIGFNLFFFVICPKMYSYPCISFWYNPDYGVGYVFVANILSTAIQTLFLLPYIFAERFEFSFSLLKKMLRYSVPLLVLGVCGIMNQTLDKICFKYFTPAILTSDPTLLNLPYDEQVDAELGIYGACFKVALIMMMFTQAFRYAYEPFVFAKQVDKNAPVVYADTMKYYILFSYLIMLGMIFFMDILKYLIAPSYWEGLVIIPIVLLTYFFQGVYFNLSFWYKLSDRTFFGAIFSFIGLIINFVVQLYLVPRLGYIGSAIGACISFFSLMIISYIIGQHYLKIPYDLKMIGKYTVLVLLLLVVYYCVLSFLQISVVEKLSLGCGLLIIFCYLCYKNEVYVLWHNRTNS